MTRSVPAIYENGAFRSLGPVPCHEHERVVLTVESVGAALEGLLDQKFLAYYETQADDSALLEAVQQALA